jgi:alginate O-acetyltransferase complex protein AlgI
LSPLCVFKYGASFLSFFGVGTVFAVSLPIGLSFYTFQSISYTIDLYKGYVEPQRDPLTFMSYFSMFPQIGAGPIVRYADIKDRLTQRRVTAASFSEGVTRFVAGLGKKVIFANHVGKIATELLNVSPGAMTTAGIWLGAVMYAFQIYFDFSGYSDMAIGLVKMIGFDFKENFDHPYTAVSITDFWRRWHISLSTWFRDYVYVPLSSSLVKRKFKVKTIYWIATPVVWLLTGLWHGASINFLLWGTYYCIVLIVEKFVLRKALAKIPVFVARFYSLLIILIGWLIFYYTDLAALSAAAATLFGLAGSLVNHNTTRLFLANLWILPVFALFSTKIPLKLFQRLKCRISIIEPMCNVTILCISIALMIGQSFSPFLYFRF